MGPENTDVNNQNSSAGSDVSGTSSTQTGQTDQTTPAPESQSPATDQTQSKTSDAVPYDRFKKVIDEKNALKEQLESMMQAQPQEPDDTDDTIDAEEFLSSLKPKPQQQAPASPADTVDAWNESIKEQLDNNPGPFLQNWITQAFNQGYSQRRQDERMARQVSDFNEEEYVTVDDETVIAAQNNPELIRGFIAAEIARRKGKKVQPTQQLTQQPTQPLTQISGTPTQPAQPMNEKEKYEEALRLEGEKRYEAKMRAGSMTNEGAATGAVGDSGDVLELDNEGRDMMSKLGVDPNRGVKRLAKILSMKPS